MDAEQRRRGDRELFDRIARQYSNKDREPYSRAARRHRLLSSVAGLPALGNLLEIGCGAGFSAEYLSGRYERYLGLDYSAELIAAARECHTRPEVRFEHADVEQFATEERFDTILMIGVLHHIPDPSAALARLGAWLSPGGRIIVNEPQRGNPVISAARRARKKLDPDYSEDQVELSRQELLALFAAAGYTARCSPQGVLSTPFAETAFPLGRLGLLSSRLACFMDRPLEALLARAQLEQLAWNLVVQAWPQAEGQR